MRYTVNTFFWFLIFVVPTCILVDCTETGDSLSPVIDGYTDNFSYKSGDTFQLYINSKKKLKNYRLKINDINGNLMGTVLCDLFSQESQNEYPYKEGFGYKVTVKSTIPNLCSGIYLFDNTIPFLVRPNEKTDILILYSSNTENAYSNSGGKSLYRYNSKNKIASSVVSFLRPIGLPISSTEFLQWITLSNKYDIGYICDKDLDNYENIKESKLLIIPGHSEYWTKKARKNFDNFIKNGNNALILSGNTMWWQVFYDKEYNQITCFKTDNNDTINNAELEGSNWSDSNLDYPVINSIGLDFNHGGMGKLEDYGWDGFKIVNPKSPLLNGTGLKKHDILNLKSGEYDGTDLTFNADSSIVDLTFKDRFYRYELIGYDLASRYDDMNRNGSWIIMQKSKDHGVIINTGSTDWCRIEGMKGKNSKTIKLITLNMIDLLLQNDKNKLFTTKPKLQ